MGQRELPCLVTTQAQQQLEGEEATGRTLVHSDKTKSAPVWSCGSKSATGAPKEPVFTQSDQDPEYPSLLPPVPGDQKELICDPDREEEPSDPSPPGNITILFPSHQSRKPQRLVLTSGAYKEIKMDKALLQDLQRNAGLTKETQALPDAVFASGQRHLKRFFSSPENSKQVLLKELRKRKKSEWRQMRGAQPKDGAPVQLTNPNSLVKETW
ncbi:hypothetical protein DNTS_004302 [Danionella cerebrum]|uniref:Uncharacterized protein n=1 Tax=Danionella cerebrum TaxID=2873325 RepID=A0A553N1W2_9TELE|nr:hypothetical protein DNTS_004302 [Danionella translucida]